jgi:N-acetylglutamate synthase/N-acetylornithine aminotransferase
MRGDAYEIAIDLGAGRGAAEVLTGDLTEDYIRINADYRS